MNDLISRQAAIDALKDAGIANYLATGDFYGIINALTVIKNMPTAEPDERMLYESCTDCPLYDKDRHSCPRFNKVIPVTLRELQSAQPEQLTDKEQRIFLAAMGREEKVCKEVDAEMTREPYEDSLVRVCHEITRKVKGALWNRRKVQNEKM